MAAERRTTTPVEYKPAPTHGKHSLRSPSASRPFILSHLPPQPINSPFGGVVFSVALECLTIEVFVNNKGSILSVINACVAGQKLDFLSMELARIPEPPINWELVGYNTNLSPIFVPASNRAAIGWA
jgi:hypothetical protein